MARAGRDNHTADLSDAEVLERAEDMIDDFLLLVRNESGWNDIFDVSRLPVAKTTIVNAFRLVISTEPRPEYRLKLAKAGILLSRFQDGIGPKISLVPVSSDTPGAAPSAAFNAAQNRAYIERFDRAFALIEPDAKRLSALFESAIRLAERRQTRVRDPQVHGDGTYTWHGHH